MVETASGKLAMPSGSASDRVRKIVMASGLLSLLCVIVLNFVLKSIFSKWITQIHPPPPEVPTSILFEKVLKLNSILESLNLIPSSRCSGVVCKKEKDSDVMLIELIKNNDCPNNEEMEEGDDVLDEEEFGGDHFNKFPTRSELAYHKHVHVGRAYIDLDSPLNIMTRTLYNWIMTNPLEPKKDSKSPSGISNFTGRVIGMPIFVGNLTYTSDFTIVEDISSVIDPRMSPAVLGKPFVELSNLTYDLSLGVVKFTNEIKEIAYKMPYKIEQYDSLSDMEKENTKSVYFRNEEDKRKGVDGGGLILYQAYDNLYAMTGRKAHLLEDKQISSVGVFDEVTWKTFGGNTRDLGSILEETGQEYDFTPKEGLMNKSQMLETASGKLATPSGYASDRVKKIVTVSGLGVSQPRQHVINVITDKPINQTLNGLEASRRLAKWSVEHGAYGITYALRNAIKGQVLADFLADTMARYDPPNEGTPNPKVTPSTKEVPKSSKGKEKQASPEPMDGPDVWKLYTDGASNDHGSGAGLILIDPEGVEYSNALRLNFSNSNNDAEYKALLAGLRITVGMKVERMHAFMDSKLVVNQISHIPREENKKADALSKLAAIQCEGLKKWLFVEELNERSMDVAEVNVIVEEERRTWMTPIRKYIEKGLCRKIPLKQER
ncbi:retrotransposon ORF1 [Tanacetum coccineum]